jgi:hypothetical protein
MTFPEKTEEENGSEREKGKKKKEEKTKNPTGVPGVFVVADA